MTARRPPTWSLLFPDMKCPGCGRVIRVRFYGRYRFRVSKRGKGGAFADRKMDPELPGRSKLPERAESLSGRVGHS